MNGSNDQESKKTFPGKIGKDIFFPTTYTYSTYAYLKIVLVLDSKVKATSTGSNNTRIVLYYLALFSLLVNHHPSRLNLWHQILKPMKIIMVAMKKRKRN